MPETSLGIYIHIPFCRSICAYCGFIRYPIPASPSEPFIHALCREIESFEGPSHAQSVFLGGGTPSILTGRQLDAIFSSLHKRFRFSSPEISIEVNPDDVNDDLVKTWKQLGINRVSIGVQSFDDATLRLLGRRHNAYGALYAIELIAQHFDNWGIDLIYGASPASLWQESLKTTATLSPPHISTYALTYIPGTPLDKMTRNRMPDDEVLQLYQYAEIFLTRYEHYEVSNFALPGFQCRHNRIYWKNEWHAGFGPGAYSLIGHFRMANPTDVNTYLAAPGHKAESIELDLFDEEVETLIQHFRLREGILPEYYEKRFGESLEVNFGESLQILMDRKLLEWQAGRICPTAEGFYLNDEIGLTLVK